MKENITSQLVQAGHIAGKNILECHSSSLKRIIIRFRICFLNSEKNFGLL